VRRDSGGVDPKDDYREELKATLKGVLQAGLPRILSQMDRDPDSPTYGCFDRDFWHYKMRDFSSAILQQGVLVLDAVSSLPELAGAVGPARVPDYFRVDRSSPSPNRTRSPKETPSVRAFPSWADAAVRFWAAIQARSGGFDEYYPFEEGFPPAAFGLYAVALYFRRRGYPMPEPSVGKAVQKCCSWLLAHPESQALNQEAAALAGLEIASKIPGVRVDRDALEKRKSELFASQSEEGWFPEYGGADLGYLSVTLDCLWDMYDASGDGRASDAVGKAVKFLAGMISVSRETPVMTNSRNTDYVVPYGLVRAAATDPLAAAVVKSLFSSADHPGHFLARTDDRYSCHYIHQSVFRCYEYLSAMVAQPSTLPCEGGFSHYHPHAGIAVRHTPGEVSLYLAARKGGVAYVYSKDGIVEADYGWRSPAGNGKVAVTHWQEPDYQVECSRDAEGLKVSSAGHLSVHGWVESTPLRHAALRAAGLLLGSRLIPLLKRAMIFGGKKLAWKFGRTATVTARTIVLEDVFEGRGVEELKLRRAPHPSLRHVASAGRFTPEELLPVPETEAPTEVGPGVVRFTKTLALK